MISRDIRVASKLSLKAIHQLITKAFLFYRPLITGTEEQQTCWAEPSVQMHFAQRENEGLNKIHCNPNSTSSFTRLFQYFQTVFIFKSKELKVGK